MRDALRPVKIGRQGPRSPHGEAAREAAASVRGWRDYCQLSHRVRVSLWCNMQREIAPSPQAGTTITRPQDTPECHEVKSIVQPDPFSSQALLDVPLRVRCASSGSCARSRCAVRRRGRCAHTNFTRRQRREHDREPGTLCTRAVGLLRLGGTGSGQPAGAQGKDTSTLPHDTTRRLMTHAGAPASERFAAPARVRDHRVAHRPPCRLASGRGIQSRRPAPPPVA